MYFGDESSMQMCANRNGRRSEDRYGLRGVMGAGGGRKLINLCLKSKRLLFLKLESLGAPRWLRPLSV